MASPFLHLLGRELELWIDLADFLKFGHELAFSLHLESNYNSLTHSDK
jgi:hypothetical protein